MIAPLPPLAPVTHRWSGPYHDRLEYVDANGKVLTIEQVSKFVNLALSERREIPAEFAQLASFYDVSDMASLVRMQQEHIEGLQAKLPPTPPFPGPQRVREG